MIVDSPVIFGSAHCRSHILPEWPECWVLEATCGALRSGHSIIIIDANVDYVNIPTLLCEIVLSCSGWRGLLVVVVVYRIFKIFRIDLCIRIL